MSKQVKMCIFWMHSILSRPQWVNPLRTELFLVNIGIQLHFYHFWSPKWRRYLKPFLMRKQYPCIHVCWCQFMSATTYGTGLVRQSILISTPQGLRRHFGCSCYDIMYMMASQHTHQHQKNKHYTNGSVQDCSISSALAMEILQSCIKPLIWSYPAKTHNNKNAITSPIWRSVTRLINRD